MNPSNVEGLYLEGPIEARRKKLASIESSVPQQKSKDMKLSKELGIVLYELFGPNGQSTVRVHHSQVRRMDAFRELERHGLVTLSPVPGPGPVPLGGLSTEDEEGTGNSITIGLWTATRVVKL